MSQPQSGDNEALFANLRALAESSFPKQCPQCGLIYATAEEFASATAAIRPDCSGLKESYDDEGRAIVELFRNCVCGSTLMDDFDNRRNPSPPGEKRRQRFDELLRLMQKRGIEGETARGELLKLMRGQKSRLIDLIKATT